jgi:hypothetical protein
MTGQNTAAAERSAHTPAADTRGLPDWLTELSPGIWRLTAYVERDQLRQAATQAGPAGGIASANIMVKVPTSTTAEELLAMAAHYAAENLRATPATLRAAATALVESARRIETEGRRA